MKTNTQNVSDRAKRLVSIAKQKDLIKPHTFAFKIFPVEEEKREDRK